MVVDIKGSFVRVRVRKPVIGAKFSTHDVGLRGHTKRVAMFNPVTNRWVTQSWLFPVNDVKIERRKTKFMLLKLGVWTKAKYLVNKRF